MRQIHHAFYTPIQFLRPSWPWGFFFARWVESEPDRGAEGKVPWRCHYKMSTWPHFFCARRLRAPGHQLRSDWHLPWNSLSSSRPSELFRLHPGVDGLSDWPGRDLAIGLGISVFRCVGFFMIFPTTKNDKGFIGILMDDDPSLGALGGWRPSQGLGFSNVLRYIEMLHLNGEPRRSPSSWSWKKLFHLYSSVLLFWYGDAAEQIETTAQGGSIDQRRLELESAHVI